MEQEFKLKQIEDALRHPDAQKEDIITIFLALQRQNFCLSNSLSNLVKKWPVAPRTVPPTTSEGGLTFGISSETKG